MKLLSSLALMLTGSALLLACGDDDHDRGTEADRRGVGAACSSKDDCSEEEQNCLPFKGGYCGIADCQGDADCPSGSRCVAQGSTNYCFRICIDKIDCNRNRPVEFESNCSANVTFVDGKAADKACIPPS